MADVARTLWLGGGGGGLPGSSLPGKRLCWRQRGGFKTLIVYLSAGEPSPPSAPSLGCCGVAPRKTGREGGRRGKEGGRSQAHSRARSKVSWSAQGFSWQRLPASRKHCSAPFSSLAARLVLSRILTLQWGILQIKGDIFGTLPSWHFANVGGRRKKI